MRTLRFFVLCGSMTLALGGCSAADSSEQETDLSSPDRPGRSRGPEFDGEGAAGSSAGSSAAGPGGSSSQSSGSAGQGAALQGGQAGEAGQPPVDGGQGGAAAAGGQASAQAGGSQSGGAGSGQAGSSQSGSGGSAQSGSGGSPQAGSGGSAQAGSAAAGSGGSAQAGSGGSSQAGGGGEAGSGGQGGGSQGSEGGQAGQGSAGSGQAGSGGQGGSGQSGQAVCGEQQACEQGVCLVGGCQNASALAVGPSHSCALFDGWASFCWGQLPGMDGEKIEALVPLKLNDLQLPVRVAPGAMHSCVLEATGVVKCWGKNDAGELGWSGDKVPVLKVKASSVVVGSGFTCASTPKGEVYCWGHRPGEPLEKASIEPTLVAGADASRGLVAGQRHACALGKTGEVRCWGEGNGGQLGLGELVGAVAEPTTVEGLGPADELFGGELATCARGGGEVRCWGSFDAEGEQAWGPRLVASGLGNAEVAVGRLFFCLLDRATGQVQCRGRNSQGQLGVAAGAPPSLWMSVPLPAPARSVAAGGANGCAVLVDGRVVCWGANDEGQLGRGSTSLSEVAGEPLWLHDDRRAFSRRAPPRKRRRARRRSRGEGYPGTRGEGAQTS